jgi:nucleotide-binding universal stress UspA family protein
LFKHILVPVDLTPKTARAARIAAGLAAGGRTNVTILHVVERIEGIPAGELETFYRKLESRARKKLAPLAARLEKAGAAAVRAEVVFGNRVDEILRAATARRVDLIVLSSHRVDPRRPGAGWGTISYKVGILSRCPVLLVK